MTFRRNTLKYAIFGPIAFCIESYCCRYRCANTNAATLLPLSAAPHKTHMASRKSRARLAAITAESDARAATAHLDARSLARRTIGPCASCMPKRPIADANDMSFFGGKKARPSVDDELAAVRSAIMKAIGEKDLATVAMLERRETELKQQQAALERREAEHKQQLAKAAYEKAKASYETMQKPGPKKDAAKSAMDQAHAVYLALLGACFLPWKN